MPGGGSGGYADARLTVVNQGPVTELSFMLYSDDHACQVVAVALPASPAG